MMKKVEPYIENQIIFSKDTHVPVGILITSVVNDIVVISVSPIVEFRHHYYAIPEKINLNIFSNNNFINSKLSDISVEKYIKSIHDMVSVKSEYFKNEDKSYVDVIEFRIGNLIRFVYRYEENANHVDINCIGPTCVHGKLRSFKRLRWEYNLELLMIDINEYAGKKYHHLYTLDPDMWKIGN